MYGFDSGRVSGLRETALIVVELHAEAYAATPEQRGQRRMAVRVLQRVNALIVEAGGDPIDMGDPDGSGEQIARELRA